MLTDLLPLVVSVLPGDECGGALPVGTQMLMLGAALLATGQKILVLVTDMIPMLLGALCAAAMLAFKMLRKWRTSEHMLDQIEHMEKASEAKLLGGHVGEVEANNGERKQQSMKARPSWRHKRLDQIKQEKAAKLLQQEQLAAKNEAALLLQSKVRQKLAVAEVKKKKGEQQAATSMQSKFRQKQAVAKTKHTRQARNAEEPRQVEDMV
jgi:hypothetical protein